MCVRAIDVSTSYVYCKASCNRCRLSARWRSHRSNVSERGNDGETLGDNIPRLEETDLLTYYNQHTAQYNHQTSENVFIYNRYQMLAR